MNKFLAEFLRAALQGPRLYFAPLIGALRGARMELQEALNDTDPQWCRSNRVPTSTNKRP